MADLFPPAIVRSLDEPESRTQLISEAKAVQAEIVGAERMNLQRAIRLGHVLERMFAMCGHGEWLKSLEEIGVSQQRASDYRRVAKVPPPVLSTCQSIREALGIVADQAFETQPPNGQSLTPESPEWKHCSRDCRVGKGPANCKACAKLNATVAPAPASSGDGSTQNEASKPPETNAGAGREPGSDPVDPMHRLLAPALKLPDMWGKKIDEQAKIHDAPESVVAKAHEAAKALAKNYETIVRSPLFPGKPPDDGTCKHCGKEVIWATTQKGKRAPVDRGRGDMVLINNRLTRIEVDEETDMNRVYGWHFCPGRHK